MSNAEDLQSIPYNIAVENDRSRSGEALGNILADLAGKSSGNGLLLVLESAGRYLRADSAVLFADEPGRQSGRSVCGWRAENAPPINGDGALALSYGDIPEISRLLAENAVCVIAPEKIPGDCVKELARLGFASAIFCPVFRGDERYGVLVFGACEGGNASLYADDLAFLRAVAGITGIAMLRDAENKALTDSRAALTALAENIYGRVFIVDPKTWSVIFSGGSGSADGFDQALIDKLEWRIMEHLDSHREPLSEPLSFSYRPEDEGRAIEIRRSDILWTDGGSRLLFLCGYAAEQSCSAEQQGEPDGNAGSEEAAPSPDDTADSELSEALRQCVGDGFSGFSVYYQPRITLPGSRVIGAEALLRWQNPNGDEVLPEVFLPIIRRLGLAASLGGFVLREACRMLVSSNGGQAAFSVSVNLSVAELRGHDFLGQLRDILKETGASPARLIFDIPQAVGADDAQLLREACEQLRKIGAKTALDNFGAGSSPLCNLHELPLDIIKIDRTLISGVGKDRAAHALVRLIADYGRATGRLISIVGVETKSQLDYCHFVDADELQGFYFFNPVPPDALLEILSVSESAKPQNDIASEKSNQIQKMP